jgi:hypothetical protein
MGRPFIVTNSDDRSPHTLPDLPRISSSESGFFFCGIKLDPLVTPSPSSIQPHFLTGVQYPIFG